MCKPSPQVQPFYVKGTPQAALIFGGMMPAAESVLHKKGPILGWGLAGGRRVAEGSSKKQVLLGHWVFWHMAWKVDSQVQLSMSIWSRIVFSPLSAKESGGSLNITLIAIFLWCQCSPLWTDMLLVSTWNMTSVTAELNLKFYLLLIN